MHRKGSEPKRGGSLEVLDEEFCIPTLIMKNSSESIVEMCKIASLLTNDG